MLEDTFYFYFLILIVYLTSETDAFNFTFCDIFKIHDFVYLTLQPLMLWEIGSFFGQNYVLILLVRFIVYIVYI